MNSILGANWRTTLSGWITVLASAIAVNPSLISFLPESARSTVTGIAGLIAVVSGGTFAYAAKDKQVTGGSVANDSGKSGPTIAPLIVAVLLPVFGLSGCAWISAHQSQIDGTLAIVAPKVLSVAETALDATIPDTVEKNLAADVLDGVASALRANETTIVNSDDVERIVKIWSPNDGDQWQSLAGKLGTVAGAALQSSGQSKPATVVEQIATGLNQAAAASRSSTQ